MARIRTAPFDRALIVEGPHPSLDGILRKGGIQSTRLDAVPDAAHLIQAINETGAQVLFKRSRVPVTREVVAGCPGLFAVQLCSIGTDSVDLDACAEHGVLVFNDPVSNGRSVVELAIGHIVALARRLYETDVEMSAHQWNKTATGRFEILGKVLGIVGLGNIGRQVARAAEGLGMQVLFYDTRPVAREVGVEMGWTAADSLEELFRHSDVVSVHTSAHDSAGRDNEGFLDGVLDQLGRDRPSEGPRIFLNLARGNLHSADSLLKAVQSGAIRRAAVDVYPDEPRPGAGAWQNPYADELRVSCTPHIGASTLEAQPRIAARVATTTLRFSSNGSLRDCVFEPRTVIDVGTPSEGRAVLAVVHSVSRGTKKAVDDAIYDAGASNLVSSHRDFPNGVAYDVSVLDRALEPAALEGLVAQASTLSNDPAAIRSIRQVPLAGA